ncbi:MAG: hypothetical protein ABJQ29_04425 [Luteolibacter sp.]
MKIQRITNAGFSLILHNFARIMERFFSVEIVAESSCRRLFWVAAFKAMASEKSNGTVEAASKDCRQGELPELSMAKMLRCWVRYFTDGAVIGSKVFVNDALMASRELFSGRRKDGARKMEGGEELRQV